MISALSQMGFFAYLIIRFIAIGLVRSKWVWDVLQLIIVLITVFDLVYLRHTDTGEAWAVYFILPAAMLIIAVAIALWKVKLTTPHGFVPTLFFMMSVTAIEAVPALRINSMASTLFMLVPLTASNAWQILILPKVLKTTKEPL
jgi:KinB signaling pathway activation protein